MSAKWLSCLAILMVATFTHVTLILQYSLADHTIIQVQTYTGCIISHAVKTRLKKLKLESY